MSARNFIKLRGELADGRKVFRAAKILHVSRDAALGILCRWLLWVDANCTDAATGLSPEHVNELLGNGAAFAALADIGWVHHAGPCSVHVCEFEKYLDPTAKKRQLAAARVAAFRARLRARVETELPAGLKRPVKRAVKGKGKGKAVGKGKRVSSS